MSTVLVRTVGRIATVTLNRPKAHNAMSRALIQDMKAAVSALDADDDVGAIVLTGADPAFCAGVDLKELGSLEPEIIAQAVLPPAGDRGPFASVSSPRRTPLICAVNGPCVTGGLEVALAGDILLASERATFADTHARVGVMPSWGMSVLLPERIGRGRALQMSLSGDYIDAATACEWGLVTKVVAHDSLLEEAEALAQSIADAPAESSGTLLSSYHAHHEGLDGAAWERERVVAAEWARKHLNPEQLQARIRAVFSRGRAQRGK